MKIRTGFISNSSSTSFVVAFKKPEKCPHCGRGDSNFIDTFVTCSKDDDTGLDFSEYGNYYEELKKRCEGIEKDIDIAKTHSPNDYVFSRFTYGDQASMLQEQLEREIVLMEAVKKHMDMGMNVYSFSIAYHDELVNKELFARIDSGEAIVLCKNE